MTSQNTEPTPEIILPTVTVIETQLSSNVLEQLHLNSSRSLGIPKVNISPNAWEVSGDITAAKDTLLGLSKLIGLVINNDSRLGNPFGISVYEPEGSDSSGVYRGILYGYAYLSSESIVEEKRRLLASEVNELLTKLQSPHQL